VPKPGGIEYPFYESFQQVMREEGLATRPDWISDVSEPKADQEAYGYLQFQKLWKQRKHPDGLIAFPDTTARGVITAVLKLGIETVSSQMKFVFHRNVHMNLLCPFPVTWGISDEDVLAKKLIQIIEKQFRGEKVSPILLPYEMKADDAARWR
jgi:DNA-binding LacI/PurR family transcriptional regulator